MQQIAIRAAEMSDIPSVLELWAASAKGVSITDDADGVAALITRDPEALLLAESSAAPGGPVGTVIAGFDGWRCHLYRLAVHPDHRRQGVATLLLHAAESRFRALGGRRADAMVLRDNPDAHRTWQTTGYTANPAWSRWTKPL